LTEEIKIQAQILTNEVCQFTVDRAVLPNRSVFFSRLEDTKGSPLAEALFAIENVVAVLISGSVVKVTKTDAEQWMPIAKQVGAAIRTQIQSGQQLVADEGVRRSASEIDLREKVEMILNNEINPLIAQHGGVVSLIDVRGANLYLQLGGGCQGCGMADVTLRQGVEASIRRALPEVEEVLDVTDHAAGTNPFYSPSKK
jgi:Fe-S cluster biogenesis protein NfuA